MSDLAQYWIWLEHLEHTAYTDISIPSLLNQQLPALAV